MNRRSALKHSAALGMAAMLPPIAEGRRLEAAWMNRHMQDPVLRTDLFPEPVIIDTVELLRNGKNFLVRVREKQGAEGIALAHNTHMPYLFPIMTGKIFPYLPGKDARHWEALLEEIYVEEANYKWQGLPFWVPLAGVEFAVLDLLGKIAGVPVGALFGKVHHREIAVYQANNHRGRTAEESVERIVQSVESSGARAVKYKIGGRMRRNQDDPPGRTEKLIPLVRKALGDEMTIYADSNGSYDVPNAIRIGRMLEETGVSFYEEPCRFDHYAETLEVAKALAIPIAGGEQDSSLWLFQWMIENDALQVVQPDLFYFGGMVRAMWVARMAEAKGIPCTPHISGSGLGYLYMLQFVSAVPNAGPYHEFKGLNEDLPFHCPTADLRSKEGIIQVPTGPGLGIEWEPAFLAQAIPISG